MAAPAGCRQWLSCGHRLVRPAHRPAIKQSRGWPARVLSTLRTMTAFWRLNDNDDYPRAVLLRCTH